jgi:hypothetical protein
MLALSAAPATLERRRFGGRDLSPLAEVLPDAALNVVGGSAPRRPTTPVNLLANLNSQA